MEWSTSVVFRLPPGENYQIPIPRHKDMSTRLAEAVAMGPDAVKACAQHLTAFEDIVGASALLRKAIAGYVSESHVRVWCDTLLRDNPYARLIATAFGADPTSMISGFLLPTRDWRVILNDTAARHPVEGKEKKRERELVLNEAASDIAPVVTSNCFSSMCASCPAVAKSVPAANLMGRGKLEMRKNGDAKRKETPRANAETPAPPTRTETPPPPPRRTTPTPTTSRWRSLAPSLTALKKARQKQTAAGREVRRQQTIDKGTTKERRIAGLKLARIAKAENAKL